MAPTVLVVDDDTYMRLLVERTLSEAGFLVRSFASAAAVLASDDLKAPNVLLLDVSMPGMSGPELQVLLRERGVEVPVIFLTGSADVAIAVTAMRNGAVDFLEKPFDGPALIERVRQTLARPEAAAADAATETYARRQATLTPREREVMAIMLTGATSKEMARVLGGSFRTIEIHRTRILEKMATPNLASWCAPASGRCRERGLLPVPRAASSALSPLPRSSIQSQSPCASSAITVTLATSGCASAIPRT